MRKVVVEHPSFPDVRAEQPLELADDTLWQVVCGDRDHWRAGVYSPAAVSGADLPELERHDCPELFLLLSGRLVLLIHREGEVEEMELRQGQPVLVSSPHAGYCPDGPHSGRAFVVERDLFETEYRAPGAW
jgi:hypothetical protein